jgi:diadenosine tetraphosphate (Ap4A) HIT family hydrolase
MKDCVFCKIKNDKDITFVKDFDNWVYRISPSQFLLGAGALIHKDHKEGLTSLNESEVIEAFKIIRKIEIALKKSFDPDWFNYLQTNNSVRHLHFHILPRYKQKIEFEGEEFVDKTFKDMPLENNRILPDRIMKRIIKTIQKNL